MTVTDKRLVALERGARLPRAMPCSERVIVHEGATVAGIEAAIAETRR